MLNDHFQKFDIANKTFLHFEMIGYRTGDTFNMTTHILDSWYTN